MSTPVQASATVMINALAQRKQAEGIKVYNLSAGEPKVTTPEVVRQAAIQFIERGDIPYPTANGLLALREAAAHWLNHHYGTTYSAAETIVTAGGKLGLYLLLQYYCASTSPLCTNGAGPIGVLIPKPYWVSYPAIASMMGGVPVLIATGEATGWKLTPDLLKKAYTPACKLLVLNNGVNPTGVLYTRAEIAALLALAQELNLTVISDEVYSALVYTDEEYVSCGSFPAYRDNVVVIQSTSKSFAMTGWRVGFVFGPADLIKAMSALNSQSITGVSLVCQQAALAAFQHAAEINAWVQQEMKARRDVMISAFQHYFDLTLPPPPAALYVFVSLLSLGVTNMNDETFALRALEEANVAVVPGSAFGQPGYVRFSYSVDATDLELGIQQLAQFVRLC